MLLQTFLQVYPKRSSHVQAQRMPPVLLEHGTPALPLEQANYCRIGNALTILFANVRAVNAGRELIMSKGCASLWILAVNK